MQADVVWYGKNHIGKNPLAKFMSEVSKNCDLSQIYTNHCIRVTGASILMRMKFSSSEIMSVTGHKSVQSLAIYQKTLDKTKKEMGNIIGQAMGARDDDLQRQVQGPPPVLSLPAPPPPPPPQQINKRLWHRTHQQWRTKKILQMRSFRSKPIWMTKQFLVLIWGN